LATLRKILLKSCQIFRLPVGVLTKLRFVDFVLIILAERHGYILATKISQLAPVWISAAAGGLPLIRPTLGGASVVGLSNQAAIKKSAIDELAANMELPSKHFGGALGRFTASKSCREGSFRNQKFWREAIAQNLNPALARQQSTNIPIVERIDTARTKQQMPELVKECEDLSCLWRAIVDVDERKIIVIEAKSGIVVKSKRIL
jgi:hypothetical protein